MTAEVLTPDVQMPTAPVNPPLEIVPKRKAAPFTKENAAEMARRGAIVRAQRRAEREAARLAPVGMPDTTPDYVKERIACTRRHIERLDKRLEKTVDPQAIKWLSDSIAKLQDVERILSGRPAPAPFKPSKRAPQRDTIATLGPVD